MAERNLIWQEPRAYRRQVEFTRFRADWRESLKFAGVATVTLVGLRLVAGMGRTGANQPPAWPIFAPATAAIALALAFLLPPLMMLLSSAMVVVSEVGINHNVMWGRGWKHNFFPWDQIRRCELGRAHLGGHEHRVLIVFGTHGEVVLTVAVPARVTNAELRSKFAELGRQLVLS